MTASAEGVRVVMLPAWDLYREKRDDELHLLVYVSRRTLHALFTDQRKLKHFPLVVQVPDPKSKKDRLVNLSAREEYYGPLSLARK